MIVLALDTSLPACTVAIHDRAAARLRAAASRPMPIGHAEALFPMVEACLREASLRLEDVDLFAATVGPGSFTGVRVGLAALKGFALATGRPAVGVTTLSALAGTCRQAHPGTGPFAVAIDARRGEIYLQCFAADGAAATEPVVVPLDRAGPLLPAGTAGAFGSGARLLAGAAGQRGLSLAVLGEAASPSPSGLACSVDPDAPPPSPLYLRAPDAKPQAGKVLPRR